jgi:hypothetical protein
MSMTTGRNGGAGAQAFLEALFGDLCGKYVLIWTLQNKRSKFFNDITKVGDYVDSVKDQNDVYFGVGLSDKDYGATNRCLNENVAGIGGLWVDIDVKGPHHKKQNLPPTTEAAIELVHGFGQDMYPTAVVHSGNGIQAWWAFKEPWIFEGPEDRAAAMRLAKLFIYTFKMKARQKGWDVDSVIDLARVLRVPFTMNHKSNPPRAVGLEVDDRRLRYDPSEFEPFLIDESQIPNNTRRTYTGSGDDDGEYEFILNEHSTPPFDKFEALGEIEPKFLQSWNRTRRDMQDQSASSYDLSLASFAALARWTDQEIVDLLIASRRKHGDDLKLRNDYYARTIKRARTVIERSRAQEMIDDFAVDVAGEEAAAIMTDEKREALLTNLSALFGVKINRIVKYLSEPPQFRLETTDGNIMLGDVGNLIEQSRFRNKVASASGRYINRFKPDRWDSIAQALLDVCTPEGIGDDATMEGTAKVWINGYLDEKPPVDFDPEDSAEIIKSHMPFRRDGRICIFGSDLRKWLRVSQMENVSTKEMGTVLRTFNATPDKINLTEGGARTSKSIWVLPPIYD